MVSVYGIDRALWDHPAFEDEPYTQKQAWAWLIGAASYQEKRIRGPRGPVTLQRGEFVFSVRFLAEKWLWDRGRVLRFLHMLKKRDMLRADERDSNLVYSISNYNKFQIVKAPKRVSERDAPRAEIVSTPCHDRDKEKDSKDSKDNKSLSPRALRAEFDEKFWPVCPKKVGKEAAFKAFCKARKTEELDRLISAMRAYALERAGQDAQYTAHPSTWLRNGRWADEAPKITYANGHDPPNSDSLETIIARARALDEKPDVHH